MRSLTEEEFEKQAKSALHKVFIHEDLYGQSFAPKVIERRLLYPVSSILMKDMAMLVDAIIYSARAIGDIGCFLSVIGRPAANEQTQPFHWQFRLPEIAKYRSLALKSKSSLDYVYSFEHVLYSQNGHWGIMISDAQHGLIGGNADFYRSMYEIIPRFDDMKQVHDFLAIWKYYALKRGADVSWIPNLLSHVYGEQTAKDLLNQESFTDLL